VADKPVYQLHIRLEDIDPPVWRRVLVPGGIRLSKLHDIFQTTMGWTDSHLHNFTIGDQLYGMQFDDYPEEELDETEYMVQPVLGTVVERFVYDYDFGDSWSHEVTVEDFAWSPYVLKYVVCLDGEGACPPEDVGGAGGYAHFLEAMNNPLHDEHDSYREWIGNHRDWIGLRFDPTEFNIAAINAALQRRR